MKILLGILTACLYLASFVTCAQAGSLEIVNTIHLYYGSLTTLTAKFEQKLFHKESGAVEIRSGNLTFKKPMNIFWQTMKPQKEQWIGTEQELWDYLPDEEVAYRYSSAVLKQSGGIFGLLTGQTSLEDEYSIKQAGTEKDLVKLLLLPKEPTMQLVEARIWVEREGAIQKIHCKDFYGNTNEIILSNLKKNMEIKQSLFSFKVPKGVEVEDLRNSDLQKGIFQ